MKYKLICFDLDGTLVGGLQYSWEHLHLAFGTRNEENKANIEDYKKGKINYAEWCHKDVALWQKKGITKDDILKEIKKLHLIKGVKETLQELKKKGCKLAVLSGSLRIVLDTLFPDHPFDDVYINELVFNDDGTIKTVKPTSYDMETKPDGLKMLAEKENLKLEECAFVGNSENDIKIAKVAGFSIAFNPKSEELKKVSDVVIEEQDLKEILKYLEK